MPEKLDNNNKRDPLREMKTLNNWVGYKLIQRDGRISKMPIDPHTGKGAKADDASTWGSYEQALEAVKNYNLDGVGFEFGVDFQGYVGIDLDHVLLEDGTLKPFAAEIVNDLNSYTEYSPSGTGIHAFCKADTSMENWEYGQNVSHRNDSIGVEIYDKKRYFTVTEKTYGEVKNVANRSSQLKEVYRKYL